MAARVPYRRVSTINMSFYLTLVAGFGVACGNLTLPIKSSSRSAMGQSLEAGPNTTEAGNETILPEIDTNPDLPMLSVKWRAGADLGIERAPRSFIDSAAVDDEGNLYVI